MRRIITIALAAAAWASAANAQAPGTQEPAPPAQPPAPSAQPPADKPAAEAVWIKTKAVTCEVLNVQHCRAGGCTPAAKLPSFRIDLARQTMCGLSGGACVGALKIGEIGLDRTGERMTVHALGVAFVVGIDADGTMNGADVVKGRVVSIQGRCVPS